MYVCDYSGAPWSSIEVWAGGIREGDGGEGRKLSLKRQCTRGFVCVVFLCEFGGFCGGDYDLISYIQLSLVQTVAYSNNNHYIRPTLNSHTFARTRGTSINVSWLRSCTHTHTLAHIHSWKRTGVRWAQKKSVTLGAPSAHQIATHKHTKKMPPYTRHSYTFRTTSGTRQQYTQKPAYDRTGTLRQTLALARARAHV